MNEFRSSELMDGAGMRSRLVSMAIFLAFVAIAVKGGMIALGGERDQGGVSGIFAETPARAEIVDRHGSLLATSVTAYSLFADPRAMMDGALVAQELKAVLPDLDTDLMTQRLQDRERAFVWIKRGLTPRQRQAVFELGLEGLGFREEARRVYPRGTLAGHVLGYAGADGQGLSGVEYSQDDRLRAGGEPLALTIDANIQFSLEVELAAAIGEYDAEAGAGIIMRAEDAQVLALASWPPLDPNRARTLSREDPARLNRASGAVYELGSVFKPLTIAAAIDAGAVRPNDKFDIREPLVVRGRKISDTHPIAGRATPIEIVAESSNIGTVQIAWRLGGPRLATFLSSIGLFQRAPVELAGSAAPILPEDFDDLSSATASYGHGIAVSPMAFASAFNVLANQGEHIEPTLLMEPEREQVRRRVMSAPTANLTIAMMREAVINGTGEQAEVAGYRVAGKTGTAEKPIAGGYSETENICSFAAVFPADSPEYVVLIVLDSPKAGDARGRTAAWNAAPTAGRVIERIAGPILGMEPQFSSPASVGSSVHTVSDRRSRPL